MKAHGVQSHLLCVGLHGRLCTSNVPPHEALCVAGVPLCTRRTTLVRRSRTIVPSVARCMGRCYKEPLRMPRAYAKAKRDKGPV